MLAFMEEPETAQLCWRCLWGSKTCRCRHGAPLERRMVPGGEGLHASETRQVLASLIRRQVRRGEPHYGGSPCHESAADKPRKQTAARGRTSSKRRRHDLSPRYSQLVLVVLHRMQGGHKMRAIRSAFGRPCAAAMDDECPYIRTSLGSNSELGCQELMEG